MRSLSLSLALSISSPLDGLVGKQTGKQPENLRNSGVLFLYVYINFFLARFRFLPLVSISLSPFPSMGWLESQPESNQVPKPLDQDPTAVFDKHTLTYTVERRFLKALGKCRSGCGPGPAHWIRARIIRLGRGHACFISRLTQSSFQNPLIKIRRPPLTNTP